MKAELWDDHAVLAIVDRPGLFRLGLRHYLGGSDFAYPLWRVTLNRRFLLGDTEDLRW